MDGGIEKERKSAKKEEIIVNSFCALKEKKMRHESLGMNCNEKSIEREKTKNKNKKKRRVINRSATE